MKQALNSPADTPISPPRKPHRASRPQLLSRSQLDGRTNAARQFERLVGDITSDLGGCEAISAIETALIEAFAGAAVTLDNLNVRLVLGETIDLSQHALCVSAMVRVASRLGLQRRSRDVTPTLGDLLRAETRTQP